MAVVKFTSIRVKAVLALLLLFFVVGFLKSSDIYTKPRLFFPSPDISSLFQHKFSKPNTSTPNDQHHHDSLAVEVPVSNMKDVGFRSRQSHGID